MKIIKHSSNLYSKLKTKHFAYKFNLCVSTIPKCFILPVSHNIYIFTTSRYFSFSSIIPVRKVSSKSGKYFAEIENEYAHEIMENSSSYSPSILKFPLKADNYFNFEKSSDHTNIFEQFVKISTENISEEKSIEDKKFSNLVKNICYLLPQATDNEIQMTLHYLSLWPPTPKTYTPNFKALWNTLDQECVKRIKNWDVSYKLLISDYWFHLSLSRITQYNRELIFNLFENCETLSDQQIVQLMFYVNLQRKLPNSLLSKFEKKIASVCKSLSIEELSIICLAFFKTQSKIYDVNLIQFIIKQLILNFDNVKSITVAAILKFLRKSSHNSLIDAYISIMHKSIPYMKNWDIPTCVHLALLSSECNVYHPLLLNCVSNKIADEISKARLKDCTKLLQCLSQFNHFPTKEFNNIFFEEIQKEDRQSEVNFYPSDIIYSSLYYAYMGHFNYKVLEKIFQKQFIKLACSKHSDILPAFVEIDYCVEIECQEYFGPKLDTLHKSVLERRRGNLPSISSDQNMQTRLLTSVYDCLVEIVENDANVFIRHVLPHSYSPDIIVRLHTFNVNSLQEVCSSFPSDTIVVPPKNEVWACFVVCGTYSFAYRSKHMTGVTAMKLRQLEKLGFNVVSIPYFDLPQNPTLRKNFLMQHLNVLKNKNRSTIKSFKFSD